MAYIRLLKKLWGYGGFIVVVFMMCGLASASDTGQLISKQQICLEAKKGVASISPAALKTRLDAGDKFVLLDVRTEAEYRAGYISGAIWSPRGMLELKIQKVFPNSDTEIIIYCGQGCRGNLAVKTLAKMGYKRVTNLTGGLKDWTAAGYSLYNKLGEIKNLQFGNKDTRKSTD